MRYTFVGIVLLFATTLRAQVFKDFSLKAGLAANSVHHKGKYEFIDKTAYRFNTPYNYLSYFFAANTTFVFGKRMNIGLETYLIAKGYKSEEINFSNNTNGPSKINYVGLSLPFKWKFKGSKTAKGRRFYLTAAPRMDFELNIKRKYAGGESVYDSTRKLLPGFYIAPGIEWKKEKYSYGIEIFYSIDFPNVYDFNPKTHEPVEGRHFTLGLTLVYRRYYMKSKNFYNKYY